MKRILCKFVLALAGLLTLSGMARANDAIPGAGPLFATTLTDLQDKPLALESLRGKPMVVNFWARWCGPCREEIPQLEQRFQRFKGKGVEVVGIAIEEKAQPVQEFAQAYEMNYRILLAGEQGIPLLQSLGNTVAGLPFTLAIDSQGKVVYKKLGVMKPSDMDAAFAAAVKTH